MKKTPGTVERVQSFFREYTEGMSSRDVQRLFDRDAARAYAVLTREHSSQLEPKKGFKRFLYRAKLAFLGVSYKLSPPRRLLFAGSLIAFLLALVSDSGVRMSGQRVQVIFDLSPLWGAVSLGGLIFLLALELVEKVRVRDELEVARELQSDLMPHVLPNVPGYLFAHSWRTANEVGGDYYDVKHLPDGRVALVVGDASGHGMAAGLVMAIADATLETAQDLDPTPERTLTLLNRTLCRTGNKRNFMSIFYALLDPRTGEMDYICAGHPFPLLRREGGKVEELGCGGFPLGIREPLEFVRQKVVLHPGDVLLMYTDGLPEAVDPEGRHAFGYDQIKTTLELGGTPQNVHDGILRGFDAHVGEEPIRDDLTLVVIARLPPLPWTRRDLEETQKPALPVEAGPYAG